MSEYQQDVLATLGADVLNGDVLMLRMVYGWHELSPLEIALLEIQEKVDAFMEKLGEAVLPFIQQFSTQLAEVKL